jgi:hypothetical protein
LRKIHTKYIKMGSLTDFVPCRKIPFVLMSLYQLLVNLFHTVKEYLVFGGFRILFLFFFLLFFFIINTYYTTMRFSTRTLVVVCIVALFTATTLATTSAESATGKQHRGRETFDFIGGIKSAAAHAVAKISSGVSVAYNTVANNSKKAWRTSKRFVAQLTGAAEPRVWPLWLKMSQKTSTVAGGHLLKGRFSVHLTLTLEGEGGPLFGRQFAVVKVGQQGIVSPKIKLSNERVELDMEFSTFHHMPRSDREISVSLFDLQRVGGADNAHLDTIVLGHLELDGKFDEQDSLSFDLLDRSCTVAVHATATYREAEEKASGADIETPDVTLPFLEDLAAYEDVSDRQKLDEKFREEFPDVDDYLVIMVPGYMTELTKGYFDNNLATVKAMGIDVVKSRISTKGSSKTNALVLIEELEELYEKHNQKKKILWIGHSKGGVDIEYALGHHGERIGDKLSGVAHLQSPLYGSYVPDTLKELKLRELIKQVYDTFLSVDKQAMEDLTVSGRNEEQKHHPRQVNPPCFSVISYDSFENPPKGAVRMVPMFLGTITLSGFRSDGFVVPVDGLLPGCHFALHPALDHESSANELEEANISQQAVTYALVRGVFNTLKTSE